MVIDRPLRGAEADFTDQSFLKQTRLRVGSTALALHTVGQQLQQEETAAFAAQHLTQ